MMVSLYCWVSLSRAVNGVNVVAHRGQHRKHVTLAMIDRCLNTPGITACGVN